MKVTVLIDNVAGSGLAGEWGLSFYIEFKGKKYLLDAGSSGKFAENARRQGIDLGGVDCAVLSTAEPRKMPKKQKNILSSCARRILKILIFRIFG